MRIKKTKHNISAYLLDFPTSEELDKLNSFRRGNYFICDRLGYKRLLSEEGELHRYICMECPIKEWFTL